MLSLIVVFVLFFVVIVVVAVVIAVIITVVIIRPPLSCRPPPLPLPLGVGCPRRRRLTRLVMVRARGVGVVDAAFSPWNASSWCAGASALSPSPPPRSSSSDPLDGAILNALSRYAHTALALTPSSTPWASALLEGSASNASLRCSVRLGGDGE